MTVNSRVIKTFLQWSPEAVDVPLMNGLRVQILPTIDDLPRARKHQFAAFVASALLFVHLHFMLSYCCCSHGEFTLLCSY